MIIKKIALALTATLGITNFLSVGAYADQRYTWQNNNGKWYYYEDGNMLKGWQQYNRQWYYLGTDGQMQTGWVNDGGLWYYLYSDGSMAHDTFIGQYQVGSNGEWIQKQKKYTFNEGLNKFCADSSSALLKDSSKDKNCSYSPVSLFMALVVLSQGSDNNTKADLMNALNISEPEKLNENFINLYNKESFKDDTGMCRTANSIWIDNNNKTQFNEDTLKKVQDNYKAGIFKRDLQADETSQEIADYLNKETMGKLNLKASQFKASKSEVMDIFNTVYFKDRWLDVFDKEFNTNEDFTLQNGSKVSAEFMNKTYTTSINKGSNYVSAALPFKNGHKMMFILPNAGVSCDEILTSGEKINEVLSSLNSNTASSTELSLSVPKFDFSSSYNLNDMLKKIGFSNIYDSKNADFSKYSNNTELSVSNVKQQSRVSIDEDGGEAAAYTEISVDETACMYTSHDDMKLNRPFIFAIANSDNTPLFIGVVNNPTVK